MAAVAAAVATTTTMIVTTHAHENNTQSLSLNRKQPAVDTSAPNASHKNAGQTAKAPCGPFHLARWLGR